MNGTATTEIYTLSLHDALPISSKQWFPIEGVTHEQAKNSVIALRRIIEKSNTKEQFISEMRDRFDVYRSVGCDGEGTVLFTGYYSPDFHASRTPTSQCRAPLYERPSDLVSDPNSGEPLGRKLASGAIEPWPTRRELVSSGELIGTELVWVRDNLDAYIIHVNGSARLRMDTGELIDRKSTRLNSSHVVISYAVFCLKKKNRQSYLSSKYK